MIRLLKQTLLCLVYVLGCKTLLSLYFNIWFLCAFVKDKHEWQQMLCG